MAHLPVHRGEDPSSPISDSVSRSPHVHNTGDRRVVTGENDGAAVGDEAEVPTGIQEFLLYQAMVALAAQMFSKERSLESMLLLLENNLSHIAESAVGCGESFVKNLAGRAITEVAGKTQIRYPTVSSTFGRVVWKACLHGVSTDSELEDLREYIFAAQRTEGPSDEPSRKKPRSPEDLSCSIASCYGK